ncbi:PTS system mannose/fructose/sorbose family transporter subunit IID [Irregularibacter muris]|uniref:PTS system mannose/fructose/sorbose family transporter subunit IID n=1 Tax=Irregularibacter muris TaxID=1796619 RepID=A0AAE3L4F6_9FIRM|nr:PTS system mannose/fructose/sorbose family transporter subunit IID [Irregularibacter muris]MCR1900003.1 PTS system mannose/fructose/sorbose family transporter subunit IID [Irregularibacter muris]
MSDIYQESVKSDIKLTKKDVNKSFFLWWWICEISNSFERLQTLAFCACISPILKKLYPDEKDLSEALMRHLNFFNSQGIWGGLVHGITIAMEEQKARGEDVPEEAITGIKTGLMGPFAGIGDTVDWGTWKPICFALGVTFASNGSAIGAILPFLFTIITLIEGYYIWNLGYSLGQDSIKTVLKGGWVQELITGASILGLFMMGALSANFVKLTTPLTIKMANAEPLAIQNIFDQIAPGILPLAITFIIYWYLKNKGQNYTKILLTIIIASLLGALIGIF